jgi:ABC-type cobalt transport system substrate-binding protein
MLNIYDSKKEMQKVFMVTFICMVVFAIIWFSGCLDQVMAFSGNSGDANKALQDVFDALKNAVQGVWGKIFSIGLIAVAVLTFTRGGILFGFLMVFLAVVVPMIPKIIEGMGFTF